MKANVMPMRSLVDKVLVFTLGLFAFIALVFEPLYYFGCNWYDLHDACDLSPYPLVRAAAALWRIYGAWDPLFLDIPVWLRIMCTIEVVFFGPLYALSAFLLWYRNQWLPLVTYSFSGALFYSTVVYFAAELLYPIPGTNLLMVIVVNIPWSILPIALVWRVHQLSSDGSLSDQQRQKQK